ncbi:MAG: alpha-1,4-glucan--maltose-1-phosphate maltosyltransferase [Betaproteobacteria bacterium]
MKSSINGAGSGVERRRPAARSSPMSIPEVLSHRAIIEHVRPQIEDGRFPIKRTPGETVEVSADVFADGHDVLVVVLRDRPVGDEGRTLPWRESAMRAGAPGTDEWLGGFDVSTVGWHEYAVTAWIDRFQSWRHDLHIKAQAGLNVPVELVEGALLVREAAERAAAISEPDAAWLLGQADTIDGGSPVGERIEAALGDGLAALMLTYADRSRATTSVPLRVRVDRPRARFSAWYEMFPRSSGGDPTRSGTFDDAAALLRFVADLGFDVVYLPPIHPIGTSFRKGRNNRLTAAPGDPGSPWAIGSRDGGHTAVEPSLGTLDDFDRFREAAERLGLEVALDLAWQCSPDHPWVTEHPDWFRHRPDGSIKYAENPPKKYQDILPLDFECDDWRALWQELLDVTLFWVSHGVRIFRVDNPHTKTFGFWEWMIREVQTRHPDVLFLAEAFTRPRLMQYLAKAGFSQSYTYFTWRNTKAELTEYLTELTGSELREYLRPNFFTNTPDILHAYLQDGGRPAFIARLVLAATLSPSYGIYSGFELCENRALGPGSEEYANSEKYEYRHWARQQPGNINEIIARVNRIRAEHAALQYTRDLRFHATDNPEIVAYSKASPADGSRVFVVVNLDPHHAQHGWVQVPPDAAPAGSAGEYIAHDLLDDAQYTWRGEWNYVRFDPDVRQAHILKLDEGSARP